MSSMSSFQKQMLKNRLAQNVNVDNIHGSVCQERFEQFLKEYRQEQGNSLKGWAWKRDGLPLTSDTGTAEKRIQDSGS